MSEPDIRSWLRTFPTAELDVPDSPPPDPDSEPYVVFLHWLEHAAASGVPEANVCVLSTVTPADAADARILILRDVTPNGWWFSGPAFSPKGVQLAANSAAALTFYWREHGRQVRISGTVQVGGATETERDFLDRSPTARSVAAASDQSAELVDEGDYREAVDGADPDTVPEHWRTWCLAATTVEFWQADPGGRHRRWQYTRPVASAQWTQRVLWP